MSGYLFSNGIFALQPFSKEGEELLKNIARGSITEVYFGFNGEGLCVRNICALGDLMVSNDNGFLEVPISVSAFVPPGGRVKFGHQIFEVVKVK